MKKTLLLLVAVLTLVACHHEPHFITDKDYRNEVHQDFENRVSQFSILNSQLKLDTLCQTEREAMEFLYAYMPLSDLADYEPSFYLNQVRYAFKAREEMPWGKDVPEDIFRHFVLVYRVNNENLDTARMVFYRELKERVKGMTMEEAALEVNHWCHEHVAYRASDSRTSSPLATLRTSLGRCGEESTFTVTALRAVGIPARQCYTPRWAHCDDNHAWVEVYVDGEWKFLGACEPDPHLNMGWFSVPSTRCMMVHTKAFGKYKGDEEVVKRTGMYSELNLLSHYAPTRRVTVTVLRKGKPVEGAQVKFKIYNYAEYYPIATVLTDKEGKASLTTGYGHLLVWATDGNRCAFEKMLTEENEISLNLTTVYGDSFGGYAMSEFDIVPPVAGEPKVVATEEEIAVNAKRLAYEDSLRNAYTATFHSNSDNPFVRKSEGNYAEIERFIAAHPDCADYLSTFSDKDLRDISADVLEAHWTTGEGEVYNKGLLPARISNEMVRPYRQELGEVFKGKTAFQIRLWMNYNIVVDDTSNYYNCPISPVGVYKIRHADAHSRDIFFVAACRAAGVPAYLDNATNTIYCWDGERWVVEDFREIKDLKDLKPAQLTLTYRGKEPAKPVYWPHFTLAKMENGDLRTFDFEDDPRMASFPATIELEPGIYCLSTGNRYPDGAVRSRMEFFKIKSDEKVTKEIIILPLLTRTDELGILDKNLELFDGIELWDYAGNSGMLYVNLGNYSEPSKHLIVELKGLQKEVKAWGGMTFMVGPKNINMPSWGLANTDFAFQKGLLEQRICEASKFDKVEYPLVALIDKDGHILYHSTGYKIGVIEQVLKAAK
jgi:transglutaminase-like putative cysteine protease